MSNEKTLASTRITERRAHPRYGFVGDAEVVEDASGERIEVRTSDLSRQGCYVETERQFSLGSDLRVQITKGRDSFVSQAKVVSCSARGMGLAFSEMAKGQLEILEAWLGPLRERDWLVQTRRRTQRVLMRVSVRLSGLNTLGSQFNEETHTLAVNANGALLLLSAPLIRGQQLRISNFSTGDVAEVVVVHIAQHQGKQSEVGVAFILPNPKFWQIAFPPRDWTPPKGLDEGQS